MFVAGLFAADEPARGGLQLRLKYAVGRGRRDQNAVKFSRFGYRPGPAVGVQTRFGGCTRWRQAQSISVPRVLGGAGGRVLDRRAASITGGIGFVTTRNGMGGNLVELGATVDGQGSVETQNGGGQALVRLGSYSSTRGGYVETFTTYGASTGEFPEQ